MSPPPGRMLGVDYGRRRIGLALSDGLGIAARPLGTVDGSDRAAALLRIARRADEEDAAGLVVGHPRNMDGSRGPMAEEAEGFARELAGAAGRPVWLWDERLSTRQAEALLLGADLSRKKRRRRRDGLAAQIVLQSWLDAGGWKEPPAVP